AAGPQQYTWASLARDFRLCARGSLSRAYFGGEGAGAAVALQAALDATTSGSVDAPPGVVLMRPPAALVPDAQLASPGGGQESREAWRARLEAAVAALENGGHGAAEALAAQDGGMPWLLAGGEAACFAEPRPAAGRLAELWRQAAAPGVLAAALRGHAASQPLGSALGALGESRQSGMAADAYGVPQEFSCPVLLLAVRDDPACPLAAVERLAGLLPGAEVAVAADFAEARRSWGQLIDKFLRKAWMKEFLTKRVMPQ
ncbi:unnamed protein product, partial [Prorocentrum cordatum]